MITQKVGIEVVFSAPIKMTYQVETDNSVLAISIALDYAKHRHPSKNWLNAKCTTKQYTYDEISW